MTTGGGQRFQIILLKVKKNDNTAITELYRIPNYLRQRQGENYEVLGTVYGRPSTILAKICQMYIYGGFIDNYLRAFYEIIKVFVNSKSIKSGEIVDLAVWNDVDRLLHMFKPKSKSIYEEEK